MSTVTGAKTFGSISSNFGVIAGDISGNAQVIGSQTTHHHYPQRPETPPSPSCVVPFRRDPDFVERASLLKNINELCSVPAGRVALVGIGGVGKSQLAIEHCYRTRERSPQTWIFWAHASSSARLAQSYRTIADQIKLPGRTDPGADVSKLLYDWLSNERNGKWLLVIDNADDEAAFVIPPANDQNPQTEISKGLPQSENGSIVITTRSRSVAARLVDEKEIIAVGPVHAQEAQNLIENKLGDQADKKDVRELAEALDYMPLALVQAASYIRQRSPRCSVRDYLDMFRASDSNKTSLLNWEAGHLRRDGQAKHSIITTWEISFDHLSRTRPSSADLLSLMSLFDRHGIPEELLREQEENEEIKLEWGVYLRLIREGKWDALRSTRRQSKKLNIEQGSGGDLSFEDNIKILRDYSFITITASDASTFEMHALVQLAMRTWLERQGSLETWREQYIHNLWSVYPDGMYEDWGTLRRLYPHVKSAMCQQPRGASPRLKWANVLYNACWYARQSSNLSDAEELCGRALGVLKELRGETYWSTLLAMQTLASIYSSQGRLDEAESLMLQVLKAKEKGLGQDQDIVHLTMQSLAMVYCDQGRFEEAEPLVAQVYETRKKVLGEDNPETLQSMQVLMVTYAEQKCWEECETIAVQLVRLRERLLGKEHPATFGCKGVLALAYVSQGRLKEAEELQVDVLEAARSVLGNNPRTIQAMHGLAETLHMQDRDREAISMMENCAQMSQEAFGLESGRTMELRKILDEWRRKENGVEIGR